MVDPGVLVVGGGPVGLSMALFLARHGIRSLLVERRSTTSPMPRATHVTRRSMELFREADLLAEIGAAGFEVVSGDDPRAESEPDRTLPRVVLGVRSIADLHRRSEILETGAEELAVPGPCPPFWCGQDRLEPILRRAAVRAGADVRFNHELVGLEVAEGGVTARVRVGESGKVRTYRPRFVLAADGASGRIGAHVGIPFSGLGSIARRVTILFRADLDDLLRGRRFFMSMIENPGFSGAIMRLNGPGRWAAAVDHGSVAAASPQDLPLDRCLELVRSAIGDRAVHVELDGVFRWEARHRIAHTFRRGPVFLLGDAAHLHPPSGGFGSNVGFQDAHNLAWKIAAVSHGWAGADLLDTYDTERRPVGTATAEQTLLLDGVSPDRLGGATPCDQRTLIMGYRYDSPAILGAAPGGPFPADFDLSGAPGTRVPHVLLGHGLSTLDLVGRRFVVLSTDPGWRSAATQLAHSLGVPVRGHHVTLTAGATPFPDACGTGIRGALLVRPDGFVAWRQATDSAISHADKVDLLSAALGRILGRSGDSEVGQAYRAAGFE